MVSVIPAIGQAKMLPIMFWMHGLQQSHQSDPSSWPTMMSAGSHPFNKLLTCPLEKTPIGDAALVHISGLDHLERFNLYQSNVSDNGLKHLVRLRVLHALISDEQASRTKD